MATQADREREEGVEFIHEDDGSITARDIETGVASFGETKAEALAMLSEALTLHEGGGEPIEDEAAFLEEIGLDPDEVDPDSKELPEFMQ
jgi:predicted RNase H-like HicB family nuclease